MAGDENAGVLAEFEAAVAAHGGSMARCDDPECCSPRRPPRDVVDAALDEISAIAQETSGEARTDGR